MARILCTGCGAQYDNEDDFKMEMFRPLPPGLTIASPKDIFDAGLTMTSCPKERKTPGSGPDEGEVDEQRIVPSEDPTPAPYPPGQSVETFDEPL